MVRPGLSQFGSLPAVQGVTPGFPFPPYSVDKAAHWGAEATWPYKCYHDSTITYQVEAWPVTFAGPACAHQYNAAGSNTATCLMADGCASPVCCPGYCCTDDGVGAGNKGWCTPTYPGAYSYW